jgi:hypothetical protein
LSFLPRPTTARGDVHFGLRRCCATASGMERSQQEALLHTRSGRVGRSTPSSESSPRARGSSSAQPRSSPTGNVFCGTRNASARSAQEQAFRTSAICDRLLIRSRALRRRRSSSHPIVLRLPARADKASVCLSKASCRNGPKASKSAPDAQAEVREASAGQCLSASQRNAGRSLNSSCS